MSTKVGRRRRNEISTEVRYPCQGVSRFDGICIMPVDHKSEFHLESNRRYWDKGARPTESLRGDIERHGMAVMLDAEYEINTIRSSMNRAHNDLY